MTKQIDDLIRYMGNEYVIDEYPLESYFDRKGIPKPDFSLSQSQGVSTLVINSACRRGYVAMWEIIDEMLYLTDIRSSSLLSSYKHIVFPDTNEKPVFADWFSGMIMLAGLFDSEGRQRKLFPPRLQNIVEINASSNLDEYFEDDSNFNLIDRAHLEFRNGTLVNSFETIKFES